jgi:hypothetical protein
VLLIVCITNIIFDALMLEGDPHTYMLPSFRCTRLQVKSDISTHLLHTIYRLECKCET